MYKTPVGRVRFIGLIEGVSFLVLLGIAMPLKYLANIPEAVLVVGWAHGVLFMLYVAAIVLAWFQKHLPFVPAFLAGMASVIPLGPFLLDKHLRRFEQNEPPHECCSEVRSDLSLHE